MSTNAIDPASRLAFEVKRRRAQLARNQLEVQAAGGPSNTLQTDVENARIETLTPSTAKKLDRGLEWESGSAMRVWRGEGSPTPLEPGPPTIESLAAKVEQLERLIATLIAPAPEDDSPLRSDDLA